MNSHYEGMSCSLNENKICVNGKQFSVFAEMNEVGVITSFELLLNNECVLLLDMETYLDFSKSMSLMYGEQLRKSVAYIKNKNEVK